MMRIGRIVAEATRDVVFLFSAVRGCTGESVLIREAASGTFGFI
jgi:hypothetical protein